ncbi:MAG: hypothetical protein ACE37N_04690 [Pseudohongiellaceae bacterium]
MSDKPENDASLQLKSKEVYGIIAKQGKEALVRPLSAPACSPSWPTRRYARSANSHNNNCLAWHARTTFQSRMFYTFHLLFSDRLPLP